MLWMLADFSYSFSSLFRHSGTISTHTIYNGASGRAGIGKPSYLSRKYSLSNDNLNFFTSKLTTQFIFLLGVLEILINFIRLVIHSAPFIRPAGSVTFREWSATSRPNSTLSKWLGLRSSWDNFVEAILIPTFSAICTASREDVLDHPIEELLGDVFLTGCLILLMFIIS